MSGHCDGTLWAMAVYDKPLYTGGEDQRILKWDYKKTRQVVAQKRTPYRIRAMDYN